MSKNTLPWISLGIALIALAVVVGLVISGNVGTRAYRGYRAGPNDTGACVLQDYTVYLGLQFKRCDNDPTWTAFCAAETEEQAIENLENSDICYQNPAQDRRIQQETPAPDTGGQFDDAICLEGDPNCLEIPGGEDIQQFDDTVEKIGNCVLIDETVLPDLTLDFCANEYPTTWYLWCENGLEIGDPNCYINGLYAESGPPEQGGDEESGGTKPGDDPCIFGQCD